MILPIAALLLVGCFNNLGIITDGSFTNEADLTVNNFVTAGDFDNQNANNQCR